MFAETQPTEIGQCPSCVYTTDTIEDIFLKRKPLAIISFGTEQVHCGETRQLFCSLPLLDGQDLKEVWYADGPIRSGVDNRYFWSETDEVLISAVWVDETDYPDFRIAMGDAYHGLLQFVVTKGFPNILRMWNYMGNINLGAGGDGERYKQFCWGRYDAFTKNKYELYQLPAASALGTTGRNTLIYLLAAKRPGLHFGNPQQVNAYSYPRQYGPASPSFSRATSILWGNKHQLFISGTASVIGHESTHVDNLSGQLTVTFQNIDLLSKRVAPKLSETSVPQVNALKVYLRHKHDLTETKMRVAQHFGDKVPVVYLQADICRKELLVEIDGLYTL